MKWGKSQGMTVAVTVIGILVLVQLAKRYPQMPGAKLITTWL